MGIFGVLLAFSVGSNALAARPKLVERVKPYNYRLFPQYSDENICWALAAQSILLPIQKTVPAVCKVVGRATGRECCTSRNSVLPSCNRAGHLTNALSAFGAAYSVSLPNFERAFQTLKQGGLVSMSIDVNNSAFGGRAGHSVVIYMMEKFSDGSYTLYVGDSANGLYYLNTRDLSLRKNGRYGYISLGLSFEMERFIYVYKGRRSSVLASLR